MTHYSIIKCTVILILMYCNINFYNYFTAASLTTKSTVKFTSLVIVTSVGELRIGVAEEFKTKWVIAIIFKYLISFLNRIIKIFFMIHKKKKNKLFEIIVILTKSKLPLVLAHQSNTRSTTITEVGVPHFGFRICGIIFRASVKSCENSRNESKPFFLKTEYFYFLPANI